MRKSSLKIALIMSVLGVFSLVFSSGCATMRANSARTAYIHQMTEKHVYNSACDQVWPTARTLLFSEGYAVKDTGEGTIMTLETEWRYDRSTSNSTTTNNAATVSASRYLVQGMQPDEGQCKVNFSKNTRTNDNNMNASRDLELEWHLLQQADPAAAAQIAQEAEVRASAAAQG